MTLIRAFGRRGVSKDSPFFKMPDEIPLEMEEVWCRWLVWGLAFVARDDSTGNQIDWNAKWADYNKRDFFSAFGQVFTTERFQIEYFKGMTSICLPFIHLNKTPTTTIRYVRPQSAGPKHHGTTEELRTWNKVTRAVKDLAICMRRGISLPVRHTALTVESGILGIVEIIKPLRSDVMMSRLGSSFLEHRGDGAIHWEIDVVQQNKQTWPSSSDQGL